MAGPPNDVNPRRRKGKKSDLSPTGLPVDAGAGDDALSSTMGNLT
jgi:hypothetical protein